MLRGRYGSMLKGIALQQITDRPLDIPADNLEIGANSNESPHPLVVSYKFTQTPTKALIPDPSSIDQMMIDGHGVPISTDDFPSTWYYGDPLGGV